MQEFPPKSKLDSKQYGDQNSKITEEDIKNNLEGLTTDEVMVSRLVSVTIQFTIRLRMLRR
jgi:linoleate 9S-lipoxygenase